MTRTMAFKRAGVATAACMALLAGPALADVKDGVDAWSTGDYARAVSEWQAPAAAGDPDALFNLAQAYRLGRGVELDNPRARALYEEAARRGHLKAADNFGLMLFQQGEQERAMPMIRAAAERGDPRAQYVLGLSHFNAEYAPRDWVRAYALMTLANGAGLPQARDALAQMDVHVPAAQRSEAQALARQIDEAARSQRSIDLAAADLAIRPAVTTQPPVSVPAVTSVPLAVPASGKGATAIPSPKPVQTTLPKPPAIAAAQPVRPLAKVPATPAPARKTGKWRVQLGAFGVAANADRMWKQLFGMPALSGTTKTLIPSGKVTRLLASGFASEGEATRACAALKQQGQACLVAGQG